MFGNPAVEIFHRPTLGQVTRWKATAARARIGDGTDKLPTQTEQTWWRRIAEFRHAGLEVVLVAPEMAGSFGDILAQ